MGDTETSKQGDNETGESVAARYVRSLVALLEADAITEEERVGTAHQIMIETATIGAISNLVGAVFLADMSDAEAKPINEAIAREVERRVRELLASSPVLAGLEIAVDPRES